MTSFPGSPRILKGGIVLIDPTSGGVKRILLLQYNPDTLTRTLQVQGAGPEGGDRSEALRLKGPPVETIKLEAEIDATDQLEFPKQNETAVRYGVSPQLALLESLVYPTAAQLSEAAGLSALGTFEVLPMEAPLAMFIWSKTRVMPVRITEFSVTEEAFDPALNPIRVKVSLGMRVLSTNDFAPGHRGAGLFLSYLRQKEQLAAKVPDGALSRLGIGGIS